jgi:hypothetical protein
VYNWTCLRTSSGDTIDGSVITHSISFDTNSEKQSMFCGHFFDFPMHDCLKKREIRVFRSIENRKV